MKKFLFTIVFIIFSIQTAKAGKLVIFNVSQDGWVLKAGATIYVDDKSIGYIGSNQVLRKTLPDGPHIITVRLHAGLVKLPNFRVIFVASKKPTYYRFTKNGGYVSLIPTNAQTALRQIRGYKSGEKAVSKKKTAKNRPRSRTNFNR